MVHPMKSLLQRLERYEPWVLLILPVIYASWVFSDGYTPNPDAYYHAGVARLYATQGWVGTFPWLEFTTLGPNYPNPHLLQHLVLVPIMWLFDGVLALQVSAMVLNCAFIVSVYLVLRRWNVRYPAIWVAIGALTVPLFLVLCSRLKGFSLFLTILVWFIDAVWKRVEHRACILAWLSVYAYVGAPILIPLLLVFLVIHRVWEGTWQWRLSGFVLLGLTAGMVINPMWPHHWTFIYTELKSAFVHGAGLSRGRFVGTEWIILSSRDLLKFTLFPVAMWLFLLFRQLYRKEQVSAAATTGAVVAIGLFGAGMVGGAKHLHLFLVLSLLFVPLVWHQMGPWPKWAGWTLATVAVAVSIWSVRTWTHENSTHTEIGPAEYQAVARTLQQRTESGEMVVAPWDDFPGLFHFNTHNHYVVGLNPRFLKDAHEKRFTAFQYLYDGKISDPENLLPMFFGNARHIVARSKPRNTGEKDLLVRLENNPRFAEVPAGTPSWRLFHLKDAPTVPDPN
jgi:hypothetical protein